jgi:hypothetical protein
MNISVKPLKYVHLQITILNEANNLVMVELHYTEERTELFMSCTTFE